MLRSLYTAASGMEAQQLKMDVIADNLVHRIREAAAEMESQVNRLYRGRRAYDLEEGTKLDLNKAIEQLDYMARTLREVQSEQSRIVYLQAAE